MTATLRCLLLASGCLLPGTPLPAQALIGISKLTATKPHLTLHCESFLDETAQVLYHNDQALISKAVLTGDGQDRQLATATRTTPVPDRRPVGPRLIMATFPRDATRKYRLDTIHGIFFIVNEGFNKGGKWSLNYQDPLGFNGLLITLGNAPKPERGVFQAMWHTGRTQLAMSAADVGRTYSECAATVAPPPPPAPPLLAIPSTDIFELIPF